MGALASSDDKTNRGSAVNGVGADGKLQQNIPNKKELLKAVEVNICETATCVACKQENMHLLVPRRVLDEIGSKDPSQWGICANKECRKVHLLRMIDDSQLDPMAAMPLF